MTGDHADGVFARRVLTAVTIVAVAGFALFLFVEVANLLLLVFAGLLLAVGLDGLARQAQRWIPVSQPWALALVVLAILVLTAALIWGAGPRLADQIGELRERVPQAFERTRSDLMEFGWFRSVWEQIPSLDQLTDPARGALGRVTSVFSTALGAATSAVLVLVLGVYAAIHPDLYVQSILRLVPQSHRPRAGEVLAALGHALRWWLVGRFAAMGVVGVLTALGLMIVGLPLALTLGLLAGVLAFVPYIGPVIAAIPGILIALVESPVQALWVAGVYAGVQAVEGNVITPLIQKRAVRIPPVALLSAQMIFAVLFGLVGVFLSTPLAVVAIVLVQMLYIEDVLGDRVTVLGAD